MASSAMPRYCATCRGRFPADYRICPQDGTPLEDADDEHGDPLVGLTLGDAFQIIRRVGEGGMAYVYEARHVRLPGKSFAVKVLHPAYAREPQVVARFQREAEAASGIGHPNVVDVYDVCRTPDGTPYLVSEFLRGTDFAGLLNERGRIDVPLAIHVVRQVVRALGAAHARGIVHRDVKPENVFLVGDAVWPVAKVIDFGISKVDTGQGGATLTRTGMIMGTPSYMPPEQARGSKVDHRADIYGVGAMLYRALTGQLPFESEDSAEALAAVLTEEPARPRSLNPDIPEGLELVIERAMAKDPAERYASMAELDGELEPFGAEGRGVSMLPVPPATPTGPGPGSVSTSAPTLLRDRGPSTAVARAAREARSARPTLVLLSFGAYVWVVAGLADALASVVWLAQGAQQPVGPNAIAIIIVVIVAVMTTPAVFWGRHVARRVWANTSRAVETAALLQQTVLAALMAYAVGALAMRMVALVSPEVALGPAGGGIALSLLSLAMGTVPVLLRRARRPRQSPGARH